MTTAQELIASLDKTAKDVRINPSEFIHFQYQVNGEHKEAWVYPHPVKTSEGIITSKTFGEEIYLDKRIAEDNGVELAFPDVHVTLEACYSKQTKPFRKNVLDPYWFRNGFLAQKTSEGVDIRKVLGAKFIDEEIRKPSEQAVIDSEGKKLLEKQTPSSEIVLQTQYIVGPSLQTETPTRIGRFDTFKGVIPVDAELKSEGKARWYGSYFDNDNLSAVGSHWDPFGGVLDVVLGGSLDWYSGGVLPIFTEKNPKK